jgi:hypothetical protein
MKANELRVGYFYHVRHERKVVPVVVQKVRASYSFGGNGRPTNVRADVVTREGVLLEQVPLRRFLSAAEPWEVPS